MQKLMEFLKEWIRGEASKNKEAQKVKDEQKL